MTVGPQRGCSEALFRLRRGSTLKTSSQAGCIRLGWHRKRIDQRFRCSQADLWAWLDLNLGPHPETKIARVATGSAAPRRAGLGRAHRFSFLVAAHGHGGLIRDLHPGLFPQDRTCHLG
jgi:hypothetical protein